MTASSLQIAAGKKRTMMNSPPRKGRVGNTPTNLNPKKGRSEVVWQMKDLCAAGDECKMGALPLYPHKHRCGVCGFAAHVPCGYEVWSDNPYYKPQPTVFSTVCMACIKNHKWTHHVIQREQVSFLALKNKEVLDAYQKPKGSLKLVENNRQEAKKARTQSNLPDTEMDEAEQKQAVAGAQSSAHLDTPPRTNQGKEGKAHSHPMELDSDDSSTGDQTIHMATTGPKSVHTGYTRTVGTTVQLGPQFDQAQSGTIPKKNQPGNTEAGAQPTHNKAKAVTRRFLDIKVPIGQPTDKDAGAGYRNLKTKLIEFFNGIHQVIPTFKLCELRAENPAMGGKIHDLSHFPERLEELRVYVRQAYIPNRNSEILYSKILAEWEGDDGSLRDLEWWMNQHNMAVYISKLQTPDHTRIGWFLYSVQSMGADDLATHLKGIAKHRYHIQNPLIAMRWSRIANKEKALPDDPKAMQVEVAYHQVEQVKKMLRDLYSPSAKTFPLHMRMRFVVGMDDLGSAESIAKFNRLRARQGLWVAQAVGRVTTEVINIDYVDTHIGKSLRDLIAEIPATTGATHTPLIHSIGRHYRGGYYYTCHPRKATEAQMAMNGLYARLFHKYGDLINQYFTPGGIHRAQGMTFDPDTGRVRTEGDTIIDNIEALDDDLILEATDLEGGNIPQREILVEERTVDSVSTLGGGGGGRTVWQQRNQQSRTPTRSPSVTSAQSLDSRVTAMEDTLSNIMASMHSIQTTLTQRQGHNPTTPRNSAHTTPSTGVHGSTDQSLANPPIISPNQVGVSQSASAGQADKRF